MSILDLCFNQPTSHVTVCTANGEIVYALKKLDDKDNKDKDTKDSKNKEILCFEKQTDNKREGGVGILRMYGKTNIMFLVGGGTNPFASKDMFIMWDDKKKQRVYEVSMNEPIKNLRVMEDKAIVVLDRKVNVFNFKLGMSQLSSKITYSNPTGLCTVSNGKDFVIATLGTNKGEIAIWKPSNDTYKIVQAHQNNITALAINYDGSLVATASETGTLVKVFVVETCKLKYEFRRGSSIMNIHDLAFNKDSSVLACCSGTGTVHFFELYEDKEKTKNVQSYLSGLKDYLPAYFGSHWGFKQVSIGTSTKTVCSFDDEGVLHVVSYDGKYFNISGKEYEKINTGIIDVNSG
jgi:WD40 repeat protein